MATVTWRCGFLPRREMIGDAPETFFRPPYVGCRGWIGVELGRIGDDELLALVRTAWRIVAPKKLPGIH